MRSASAVVTYKQHPPLLSIRADRGWIRESSRGTSGRLERLSATLIPPEAPVHLRSHGAAIYNQTSAAVHPQLLSQCARICDARGSRPFENTEGKHLARSGELLRSSRKRDNTLLKHGVMRGTDARTSTKHSECVRDLNYNSVWSNFHLFIRFISSVSLPTLKYLRLHQRIFHPATFLEIKNFSEMFFIHCWHVETNMHQTLMQTDDQNTA